MAKSGHEEKMLISMWGNLREDIELWTENGMPVGKMDTICCETVDWVVCGEVEDKVWELCGENVDFCPYVAHIYSVTQRLSSTAFSSVHPMSSCLLT